MNSLEPVRRDRRWLDWQPTEPITADSAGSEPTEPSKPGFVGFEGSLSKEIAKIGAERIPLGREADSTASTKSAANRSVRVGLDSANDAERPMSWADWKAATLNKLFLEQGTSGQGRITAETVRHGQRRSIILLTDKGREAQTLGRINA
jgi:hypothetical protein